MHGTEGRKEGRSISHRRQESAEQGGTGTPTLNHLHRWVHGNAEVGPDGEDMSRAMLAQAGAAANRSRGRRACGGHRPGRACASGN